MRERVTEEGGQRSRGPVKQAVDALGQSVERREVGCCLGSAVVLERVWTWGGGRGQGPREGCELNRLTEAGESSWQGLRPALSSLPC